MASEKDVSVWCLKIPPKLTIVLSGPWEHIAVSAGLHPHSHTAGPSADGDLRRHTTEESDSLPTTSPAPTTPPPITPPPVTPPAETPPPASLSELNSDDGSNLPSHISDGEPASIAGPVLRPLPVKGKIVLQTAGLATATRNATPQLGLDTHTIAELGEEWKMLCEAWILAEIALQKQGGQKPCPLEDRKEAVPEALIRWFRIEKGQRGPEPDWTGFGQKMHSWVKEINRGVRARCAHGDANNMIKEDWCVAGPSGIMLFVLGMHQWGLYADDDERNGRWKKILGSLIGMLQTIPKATDL
jgi:hypothetical protein